jgi:hypothetical protein
MLNRLDRFRTKAGRSICAEIKILGPRENRLKSCGLREYQRCQIEELVELNGFKADPRGELGGAFLTLAISGGQIVRPVARQ